MCAPSRVYEPLAPSNVHMSAELPDGLIVLSKVDGGGDSSAQPGVCWLPCVFADITTGYSLDLEVDAGKCVAEMFPHLLPCN